MNTKPLACLGILLLCLAAPRALRAEEEQGAVKSPERLFAELDKNKDGKITAAEISAEQKPHFEHLLRVAGKQKQQELSQDEFLKALQPDDLKVAAPPALGGGRGMYQQSPEQIFQRWDRNGDGKLTLEEIPEPARPRFKPMFDRLGKTELTRDDVVQAMQRGPGIGARLLRDPEGFLKRFDANEDDKLTVTEVPSELRPMIERWLGRVGKQQDDGLSLDDLKKIASDLQPGQEMGRAQPAFFRKLDADGDGKLSREEWRKAAEMFDELDLNHDGQLEPGELFGPRGGANPAPAPGGAPTITPRQANRADSRERPAAPRRPAMAEAFPPRAPSARPGGQGALARFDSDSDGKISRDEARGKLKENFDRIDANGDGFLEPGELRKALQLLAR